MSSQPLDSLLLLLQTLPGRDSTLPSLLESIWSIQLRLSVSQRKQTAHLAPWHNECQTLCLFRYPSDESSSAFHSGDHPSTISNVISLTSTGLSNALFLSYVLSSGLLVSFVYFNASASCLCFRASQTDSACAIAPNRACI